MRIATAALAGAALAGLLWAASAQAQRVPPGSYLQSCGDAHIEGDALVATCRMRGGGAQRSSLPGVNRCVGDIGNRDGVLQCSSRSGQLRGAVLPGGPGFGGPRYGEEPRGYGPREGYGDRRYGEERRERCFELRREAENLRDRLYRTYDAYERGRLEGRLHEIREREERCG
jgi:hypothetical protein